ncbi:MAG: PASTA domain-containing protein, partial [Acidimicrobiales bacterium]
VALVVVALVVALGAAGAGLRALVPAPEHRVPSLAGDTRAQAGARLGRLHLRLVVGPSRYDQGVPAGQVVYQAPAGGLAREGQAVTVALSKGPPPVVVPDLTHLDQAHASAALAAAHLVLGTVTTQASTSVPEGQVVNWSYQGATLAQGTAVDVVVSSGLPVVAVPTLVGTAQASFAGAQSALMAASLVATESQDYSDSVPAGAVIGTQPGPDTPVRLRTSVDVVVSKGPHLVTLPNLSGMSVTAATQRLQAGGVGVSGVSGNPTAPVTGTSPPSGTSVHYGSSVQLVTG